MAKNTNDESRPAWLSAGIVPVLRRPDKKEALYLVLRVFKYWDFPKGLVEKNEVPLTAAIRELEEETGIAKVNFPWSQDFVETEPYRGGKVARYYVGEVFSEEVVFGINPGLGHAEHHEFRWVTEKEAVQLLGPRVLNILHWAANKVNE
jgi:8-oxo-dGTP pyrophosphatase MutT (NUDIX family)